MLKSAKAGFVDAQYAAGVMYDNGNGVQQDYSKAMEWYKKAAANGDGNAMFAAGNLYANGYGVAKDLHEAKKWYCKGARLGHPQCLQMLGDDVDVDKVCSEKALQASPASPLTAPPGQAPPHFQPPQPPRKAPGTPETAGGKS